AARCTSTCASRSPRTGSATPSSWGVSGSEQIGEVDRVVHKIDDPWPGRRGLDYGVVIHSTPRKVPPMPRRLLSAAAACTLLLGLVACGEEEGAVSTPPPVIDIGGPSDGGGDAVASDGGGDEESPSEAPAVAAPNPADYPGMDEQTEEGAQQFTRYFFAMLIWGFQTGEYEQIEELYLDSCAVCEAHVESIREYQKLGVAWTPVQLEDVALEPMDPAGSNFEYVSHYETIVSEHIEPSIDGGPQAKAPALHFKFQTGLEWENGGWVVSDAAIESGPAE